MEITREDLIEFPARDPDGNKGTFGKCLIAGGSTGMCGAPYFAAKAAYRMGVGIVRVYTCESNLTSLQILLPEAICSVYGARADSGLLEENVKWADCVAAGQGLGTGENAYAIIDNILSLCEIYRKPLILDADGLNVISRSDALKDKLKSLRAIKPFITPHVGEMSRLTGRDISYIKANQEKVASEYAVQYGVICVLKDARTVITDGNEIYVNTNGNDGMATAGSGDVLSGILLGTVTAYNLNEYDNLVRAAAIAAYIHGMAGDAAARAVGRRGMMATDIIEGIRSAGL